ncbi:MAG: hypothetical protein ABII00_13650, partial [Elusimicrobiota bacterium]
MEDYNTGMLSLRAVALSAALAAAVCRAAAAPSGVVAPLPESSRKGTSPLGGDEARTGAAAQDDLLPPSAGAPVPDLAGDIPFDLDDTPLADDDFLFLVRNGYRFGPDGRLHAPGADKPVGRADIFYVLEDLRSRRKLRALLEIRLIQGKSEPAEKMPQEHREAIRRICRENWRLFSQRTREELRAYFTLRELDQMERKLAGPPAAKPTTPAPAADPVPRRSGSGSAAPPTGPAPQAAAPPRLQESSRSAVPATPPEAAAPVLRPAMARPASPPAETPLDTFAGPLTPLGARRAAAGPSTPPPDLPPELGPEPRPASMTEPGQAPPKPDTQVPLDPLPSPEALDEIAPLSAPERAKTSATAPREEASAAPPPTAVPAAKSAAAAA